MWPKIDSDQEKAILDNIDQYFAPSWASSEGFRKYHEIKKGDTVIAYTLQDSKYTWIYASAKKKAEPSQPAEPANLKTFYTSNNNEFAVIMKDDNTVDFEASKKLLADKLDSIANQEAKKLAEDFVKNATDADVEIKKIEGIDILFVKTKDGTKAFAGTPDSIFKDAFKGGTAGKPNFDKDKIVAPQWTDPQKTLVKYNEVGDIGYTLKNSDNDWYFAPKAKPQNKPNNGGGSSGGGSSGGGSSYSGGGSSASSSASKVTPTKTTEVKGDETVRVFALTGAVNPTITTLDDARLDEFMKKNNIAVADKNIGMTRAEVVKLLAQVTGQKTDSVDVAKLQYVDVGKNTEYAKYIAFATENKIVSGYEDGTFRPNNIISRAELMKVLVNSIGYKLADKQTQFADVEATHTLALYIQTAYNNKIINGVTATTFEPNRAITKGEFAKIIYNILYTK